MKSSTDALLAFEVRGHRDQRADRDDARAADAGHQHVERAGPGVRRRQRQLVDRGGKRAAPAPRARAGALLQLAAVTVTKLGQKPLTQE